jgi:hypothetical protein
VSDLCLTSTLSWREKVNVDDDEATKEMIKQNSFEEP